MIPRKGPSPSETAIRTPQVGVPLIKPRVPSIGSSTQVSPLVADFASMLFAQNAVLRSLTGQNITHRRFGVAVSNGHRIESGAFAVGGQIMLCGNTFSVSVRAASASASATDQNSTCLS